jgi:acetyl esterase
MILVMPLHPQTRAILDALTALGAPPLETQDPMTARLGMEAMTAPSSVELHDISDLDADGNRLRVYRPNHLRDRGALVYFHGGGWVIGSLDTHDDVCRKLALALDHPVISVDYRLAPEHPFPTPLDDCVAAVKWIHAHARELGEIQPAAISPLSWPTCAPCRCVFRCSSIRSPMHDGARRVTVTTPMAIA